MLFRVLSVRFCGVDSGFRSVAAVFNVFYIVWRFDVLMVFYGHSASCIRLRRRQCDPACVMARGIWCFRAFYCCYSRVRGCLCVFVVLIMFSEALQLCLLTF